MDGYERARYAFALFLCVNCCVYALPRAGIKRNFPGSNAQVHYNITNAEVDDRPAIDEVSYIDFDPGLTSSSKRPNVCNDCVCGLGRKTRIVGGNVTSIYDYPCDRTSIDSNAIVRRIKAATIHENFHSYTFNNDIAIIEMDQPVPVDGIVRTACLPEDRTIDYTGAIAIAVGWGRTGETKPVSSDLRKVNLPILSQEECDLAGYAKNRITENMFCAGYVEEGGRDACFGDSGGPLHIKGVNGQLEVIGIISWGRGCARPNFPGIYTKLTNYIGWLKDHLGDECVCSPPHRQSA